MSFLELIFHKTDLVGFERRALKCWDSRWRFELVVVWRDWKTSAEWALLCYVGDCQSVCYAVMCYSAVCYVLWPPGSRIFNVQHVNVRRASSCCSLVDCCAAVAAMRRKWGLGMGDEQQCSACGAAHGCALWSSTRCGAAHGVWSSTRMCIVCFGQLSVECPLTCDTCVKLQSVILKDCRQQKHLPRVVQGKVRN